MNSHADRIIGLYDHHARQWAHDRGNRLFEHAWLDRFQALLPNHGAVLDLGCGAGEPLARALIERGCRLTGVDAAPAMIDLCRGHFPDTEWIVADMRHLALARTFDGILAWDSVFHLCPDDQRRMFAIFQAHAGPDTALMFTSGPAHGEAVGAYQGEPLYHASLDPADYRALLAQHGFGVVHHIAEDPECGRHTVWLAQRIDASRN